jgi:hypothetical protein
MKEELSVDPGRWEVRDKLDGHTSIYVRAKVPPDNRWESVDIILLDLPSLFAWLRSRGGDNRWAENTVALMLGHKLDEPPVQVTKEVNDE